MADPVYRPVIVLAKAVFRALGLRFDITGSEHVPRTGGAVMALNHVGYLDFTFGGLAAQPHRRLVRFMAKKEVFDHPVGGPLMRGMKHIPVDRDGAASDSYDAAVAALVAGEIVGVFPEATISESFDLKVFKTGAARMALAAGVPLLPAVVWGSQRVYTKGRKRDLTRGTPISIAIGEPFLPEPGTDPVEVTAELKRRMGLLLDETRRAHRGTPRTPDDTWWIPASMGGTAPTLDEAVVLSAQRVADRAARKAAKAAKAAKARPGSGETPH